MNVLVVGLSHHCAPMSLLEQAALTADQVTELTQMLMSRETVCETAILTTCNRLEVYTAVTGFHTGVQEVSECIMQACGLTSQDAAEHLFVRYGNAAVEHVFDVAAGLDSMAVGESQILGQVRSMLRDGQRARTVGRMLDPLFQKAIHAAKRAHHETALDAAGPSLVEAGLEQAARQLGCLAVADAAPVAPSAEVLATLAMLGEQSGLARQHLAVIGAGAMSGLVVATAARLGVGAVTVLNRSVERGQRLAQTVGGVCVSLDDRDGVDDVLSRADIVIACTGAVGMVLHADEVADARAKRSVTSPTGIDQVFIDLAMPRDVDPGVQELPGVDLWDLERLGNLLAALPAGHQLQQAEQLVRAEAAEFIAEHRVHDVGPTVAALRQRADMLVADELQRLETRLPLDPQVRAEVAQTLHRLVGKLLHTPTVRMKSLAAQSETGAEYVATVRALFDLDHCSQQTVAQVVQAAPPRVVNGECVRPAEQVAS